MFFSKEDAIGQLFYILSFIFFGVALTMVNRDLGNYLSPPAILGITALITLVCSYYIKSIYSFVIGLITIISWWLAQANLWVEKDNIAPLVVLIGLSVIALLLYVLSRLHERKATLLRFALVYKIFGILLTTGIMFHLSTQSFIMNTDALTSGAFFLQSWPLSLLFLSLCASLITATLYAFVKKTISLVELIGLGVLMVLFGSTFLLFPNQILPKEIPLGMRAYPSNIPFTSHEAMVAILYNLALFLELIGLIFLGYKRKEVLLINLGAVILFIVIISKYFDWFFRFMDKSLFFMSAGTVLLIVGWAMEKSRRFMVTNVKRIV